MGGGLMQLIAYGAQDVYLLGTPRDVIREFLMSVIWRLRITRYASVGRILSRLCGYRDELIVVVAQQACRNDAIQQQQQQPHIQIEYPV